MDTQRGPADPLRPAGDGAIEGTTLKVGDVLDRKLRIDRVLGVGGMGIVLAATHLALGRRVAIKLLRPESLEDATVVARFKREARAAAALTSEHVARVLDVGELADGAPFMLMEFLEGADLEAVAEREGHLAPDVAVNHVLQACEAIAEAHRLGIIHRDLKPQNLFLTTRTDGAPLVKVLDFGISKMSSDRSEIALTRSRDVMGSPLYMSPEQLRGVRDVDHRTDIWAIGAILYRLISGRTPFDGETIAQVCSRVLIEEPPPLRELRPEVSDGLASAIGRCLRKDPDQRFADIADLARVLDPFSSHASMRAAHRVIAASVRPPSMGDASTVTGDGPTVSAPPAPHKEATTRSSFSTTDAGVRRARRGGWVAAVATVAAVLGAGGIVATRSMWSRNATSAPSTARSSSSASSASSSDSSSVGAPSAPASATEGAALVPLPSPIASAPAASSAPRILGKKRSVVRPTPSSARTAERSDDAPDLRK